MRMRRISPLARAKSTAMAREDARANGSESRRFHRS
jgi:hypothetical protein